MGKVEQPSSPLLVAAFPRDFSQFPPCFENEGRQNLYVRSEFGPQHLSNTPDAKINTDKEQNCGEKTKYMWKSSNVAKALGLELCEQGVLTLALLTVYIHVLLSSAAGF